MYQHISMYLTAVAFTSFILQVLKILIDVSHKIWLNKDTSCIEPINQITAKRSIQTILDLTLISYI